MAISIRRASSAIALATGAMFFMSACGPADSPDEQPPSVASDAGGDNTTIEETGDVTFEPAVEPVDPGQIETVPVDEDAEPFVEDPELSAEVEEHDHEHDEAPLIEGGLSGEFADAETTKNVDDVATALKTALERDPDTSEIAVLTDEEGYFSGFFLGENVDGPVEVDTYPGTVIIAVNTGEPGKFVVAGYNAMGMDYVTSDTAYVVDVG